jgi:two-component system cell cycle sensor histidine kinase/response regulator CckA
MNCNVIDLSEVIVSQSPALQQALGDKIRLELAPVAHGAWFHADRATLLQIATGLLENFGQFLPEGGEVVVRSEFVVVDEIHARIHAQARRGRFVRLTIANNGHGFPATHLEKLMTRVPALPKDEWGEQPLPLSLIAGIVRRRGGWIEAHSHTGGGVTFYVYFPAAKAGAAPAPVPWINECILLVDDDPAVRELVKGVLENASYDVVEAASGVEALSFWEQHRNRVKLLLTDLVMPDGVTGQRLAQQLVADDPALRVIYTSGYEPDAETQRDTASGAACFLQKPYDLRGLLTTVHAAMSHWASATKTSPAARTP